MVELIRKPPRRPLTKKAKFEVYDGIKPGEYLITVRQWEPYPSNDLLKGKFGPKKSEDSSYGRR